MEKLKIRQGTKLNIALEDNNDEKFELKSTFEKNINDSSFLISVPMQQGKRLELDEFKKLYIKYEMGDTAFVVEGFIDDYVKEGIRNYWKIRKVSENREFFQRSDQRIKARLNIKVAKRWWSPEGVDALEDLDALTLDISSGGLAMFIDTTLSVGEIVETTLPKRGNRKEVPVRSETCWVRQTEKGNAYRYIVGLKFMFTNTKDREKVERYVGGLVPDEN